MDIIAAYREAGSYRGAAQIAGTTHKTVKRVIARQEAGGAMTAPLTAKVPRLRAARHRVGERWVQVRVVPLDSLTGHVTAERADPGLHWSPPCRSLSVIPGVLPTAQREFDFQPLRAWAWRARLKIR